jgi:DNA-binding CsgD family transcriptional regulator
LLATSGAVAWLHAGRTERALEATARALPTEERVGDREVAALVSWSLARLESGREWATVEESIARIERAAVRRGDRIAAGPAVGLLGYLALSRGEALSAIRLLSDAAGHLELHDPRGLSVLIEAHIAEAAAMLGDARQAEAALERSRAHLGGRQAAWHERSRLAIASAWLLAVRGEPTRGVEQLLEASSAMEEWPILQTLMLQEALSLGAPATQVAAPLRTAAARCDAPRVAVAAAHAEALAGEDPERLVGVAAQFEEIGAWLLAAETAAQAAALFDAGGRTAPARRARANSEGLLVRCEGSSTPALRAASTLAVAITPREREIAELAATGRGNAEIADLLVISVRTVESHLYHAMSKLGVSERGELPAALEPPDRLTGSPTSDIRGSTI